MFRSLDEKTLDGTIKIQKKFGVRMLELSIKQKATQLIKELPDNANWEDLMYKIYVLQSIETGLKDSKEGKTFTVEEVRAKFGLSK